MAEAVFFVHAELGHGFAQLGQEEDRVIAKAAGAAFFGDDLTWQCLRTFESRSLLLKFKWR